LIVSLPAAWALRPMANWVPDTAVASRAESTRNVRREARVGGEDGGQRDMGAPGWWMDETDL
jgi:hypothetical protein